MTTDAPIPDGQDAPRHRGLWADAWRRFRRSRIAVACLVVIVAYVLLAVLVAAGALAADWDEQVGPRYLPLGKAYRVIQLAELDTELYARAVESDGQAYTYIPYKTDAADTTKRLAADGVEAVVTRTAWLGTDFLGRSVLRKTLFGAKISLSVALFAALISIAIGVPLGAAAGYFGGWVDEFVVWLYTSLASIPGFLLLLAFAFVLRDATFFGHELRGLPAVFLALGLTSWVGLCRLIRGEVIKHRGRDYVTAARAYSASRATIIFRHILPNVTHLILIDFSLRVVGFIQAEVILSFLGLGPTDQPSWGVMIDDARLELSRGVWWQLAAATVAVFGIALPLNVASDALRDALDPKLKT